MLVRISLSTRGKNMGAEMYVYCAYRLNSAFNFGTCCIDRCNVHISFIFQEVPIHRNIVYVYLTIKYWIFIPNDSKSLSHMTEKKLIQNRSQFIFILCSNSSYEQIYNNIFQIRCTLINFYVLEPYAHYIYNSLCIIPAGILILGTRTHL